MSSKNGSEKPAAEGDWSFEFKRAIVGGLSMTCLLLAGLLYVASPDINNVLLAGSLRIGVVLFAIWLALPQLRGILAKVPSVLPVIALVLIVLCAARPNLFRVVGSLVVVLSALLAISNWIKKFSPKR
ncbi:hypothetical protein [Mariniblastus fucicola]|uniref:Uncharacterized protein n=1 Tax=Mariniblastus fucicola TaxID=980251 RepID=A0A5B9PK75_9BACT|nr:hypothetical protein [Mariniblastus fucicola]QEG23061.1 hypothetical protein MFFC18_29530 [Mariniblastus fucicola]